MKAYVWTTHETGCNVMAFADSEEKAKEIIEKRYPGNPYLPKLFERKPVIHEDLEFLYIFGRYVI